jgi:hypothetical protein
MSDCDVCGHDMPCVRTIWFESVGDTSVCHRCRQIDDADCDECQEEGEDNDGSDAVRA